MCDDFHVIALDHRGHGDSPRAGTYQLADYVVETRDVIRSLRLDAPVLIGHSAGSKNAWLCIADNPGIASKLVITDMDPDSYNPGSVAMISRYKDETDFYESRDAVVERLRSRQPSASGEELERNVDALAVQIEGGRYTWKRNRDVVTMYDRPDVWERLPEISGANTHRTRRGEHVAASRRGRCGWRPRYWTVASSRFRAAGHWVHLEQPDAYAQTVRAFLLG